MGIFKAFREKKEYKKQHIERSVQLLGLLDWVNSTESVSISKTKNSYSVMMFEHTPVCKVTVSTGYHSDLVFALAEAKIKYDGYIETNRQLEEFKQYSDSLDKA